MGSMEKVDTGDFLSSSNTGDFLIGDGELSQSLLCSTSSLQWLVGFWWSVSVHVEWIPFFFFLETVTSISSKMSVLEV